MHDSRTTSKEITPTEYDLTKALWRDVIDDHVVRSYPTLVDLVGLPPSPELGTSNNGISLRAAFENPYENHSDTKPFAFSQYPRCGSGPLLEANGDCLKVAAANFSTMGFSVRDKSFRLTEWKAWNGPELKPVWGSHAFYLSTRLRVLYPTYAYAGGSDELIITDGWLDVQGRRLRPSYMTTAVMMGVISIRGKTSTWHNSPLLRQL